MKSHEKTNNAAANSNQPKKPSPVKPDPDKTVSGITFFLVIHFHEYFFALNAMCL